MLHVAILLSAIVFTLSTADACPFCEGVTPTLSQRRDEADLVLLAEAVTADATQHFRVHSKLSGKAKSLEKQINIEETSPWKQGTLAILFGRKSSETNGWAWEAVKVNETSAAYFASAPALKVSQDKRLSYFAQYLEHADALIAQDAYNEFGHAAYEDVVRSADKFDMAKVRRWVGSTEIPEQRRGFYCLVLGLAKQPGDRAANSQVLRKRLEDTTTDFRAGFDGAIAGYLLLEGKSGLEFVSQRFFVPKDAARGDVQHTQQALRFFAQYGPAELKPPIASVSSRLLVRPELAPAAITDLARWKHWEVLEQVAALFDQPEYGDLANRTAIVGYLRVCPLPRAQELLQELRAADPTGVGAIEQSMQKSSDGRSARGT
ncbi:MAG: hypothetical protein SGJ20_15930 [Planctomycetota bacterium]|nr:hypothetical protein [Planctomycetota bacterium]